MQSLLLSAFLFVGAIAPFTERGTVDFDVVLEILKPYGIWQEAEKSHEYHYHPFHFNESVPLSEGRWVYSDYGWFWIGTEFYQTFTSHYGYWNQDSVGKWSWVPNGNWHANPVDWRGTKSHIGWRSSWLTKAGDFEESEEKRTANPSEWVFVKREDFGKPIHRAMIASGAESQALLLESSPLSHEIELYRPMTRAGPDPLDFPITQATRGKELTPSVKLNKVAYFMTMSLPTYWAAIPATAKPQEIYIYRPNFFQDSDGIQRRIKIWHRPQAQ